MERASDHSEARVIPLGKLAAYYGVDTRTLERAFARHNIPITRVSPRRKMVTPERAQEFARACEAAA